MCNFCELTKPFHIFQAWTEALLIVDPKKHGAYMTVHTIQEANSDECFHCFPYINIAWFGASIVIVMCMHVLIALCIQSICISLSRILFVTLTFVRDRYILLHITYPFLAAILLHLRREYISPISTERSWSAQGVGTQPSLWCCHKRAPSSEAFCRHC